MSRVPLAENKILKEYGHMHLLMRRKAVRHAADTCCHTGDLAKSVITKMSGDAAAGDEYRGQHGTDQWQQHQGAAPPGIHQSAL